MKILSTKINLYHGKKDTTNAGYYVWDGYQAGVSQAAPTATKITDVSSLPATGSTPEKVETTTLGHDTRTYTTGLKDYGDLEFGFVYDSDKHWTYSSGTISYDESTGTMTLYEALTKCDEADSDQAWCISFPGPNTGGDLTENLGPAFVIFGKPSVALGAAEVGARVDFTMSVALADDIKTKANFAATVHS